MRNFTWNRFPIKNLLIDSLLTPIVENTYPHLIESLTRCSQLTSAYQKFTASVDVVLNLLFLSNQYTSRKIIIEEKYLPIFCYCGCNLNLIMWPLQNVMSIIFCPPWIALQNLHKFSLHVSLRTNEDNENKIIFILICMLQKHMKLTLVITPFSDFYF